MRVSTWALVLVMTSIVVLGFQPTGHSEPNRRACGAPGLKRAGEVRGQPICTHGPDVMRVEESPAEEVSDSASEEIASVEEGETSPTSIPDTYTCPGNGVDGRRIHVLYGHPADRPDEFSTYQPVILESLRIADRYLDLSAGPFRNQNYRWLCPDDTIVGIERIALRGVNDHEGDGAPDETDNKWGFREDYLPSLAPNHSRSDRIYLTFISGIANGEYTFPGQFRGQADLTKDDTAHPDLNENNNSVGYAMVALLPGDAALDSKAYGSMAMHELGHAMGAVQPTAQHSSGDGGVDNVGGYHCHEENDRMCRTDGGSYFENGGKMIWDRCRHETRYDCNKDDYYSSLCRETPSECGDLAGHWNIAWSGWLSPIYAESASPTCNTRIATRSGDETVDSIVLNNTSDDVVAGLDEEDTLDGGGGADTLCGFDGDDVIYGSGGNDPFIFGGFGNDTLRGGGGNDGSATAGGILGHTGDDILYDGNGSDRIVGGKGTDTWYQCADATSDTPDHATIENIIGPSTAYC